MYHSYLGERESLVRAARSPAVVVQFKSRGALLWGEVNLLVLENAGFSSTGFQVYSTAELFCLS